ncbi:hypothetical protein L6452_04997 [Arctium lappa]|uniref:Uncharacterized protein n=1 Tax=Arctium lappa TaxID=4217 RepID=A0ACB9EFL6_ARCLA|nr:hypothetical protein L6452_04997 [Arctium lappa]
MANHVGALRTRSKVAPDWTVEESLILVNEVSVVEVDCRDTLASFQKWKIIVENCNTLGVNCNLNQCRRKWDSLLSDYKKIKQSRSKKASFNFDLFKVIEWYVREYEGGCNTDPDNDPEVLSKPVLASMGLSFVVDAGVRVVNPSTVVDMIQIPPTIVRHGKVHV